MNTQDRPFYLIKTNGCEVPGIVKENGRFLGAYCYRGDSEQIDKPLKESEIVVHVDIGEGVNVYAIDRSFESGIRKLEWVQKPIFIKPKKFDHD